MEDWQRNRHWQAQNNAAPKEAQKAVEVQGLLKRLNHWQSLSLDSTKEKYLGKATASATPRRTAEVINKDII